MSKLIVITVNIEVPIVNRNEVDFKGTLEQYMDKIVEDMQTSTKYVIRRLVKSNSNTGFIVYYSNEHGVELTKVITKGS